VARREHRRIAPTSAGTTTTRGTPRREALEARHSLSEAKTVFEGETGDVASTGYSQFTPEGRYDFVVRPPPSFQAGSTSSRDRLLRVDSRRREPRGMSRTGWWFAPQRLGRRRKTYRQGSLLAIGPTLPRGRRDFDVLFEPSERTLSRVTQTRDALLVNTLDNVRGKLTSLTPGPGG